MISQVSEFFSVWITSRALGLTAYLLFFLAMATGMVQSMKGVLPTYRSGIIVIHQASSWFAWLFTLSHALVLVFDGYEGFSLSELFIPFASEYEPVAMMVGILALYSMLIVLLTSDLMGKIGRAWWRNIHFLSFIGFFFSLYHGLRFSQLAESPMSHNIYVITVSILLFLGVFRYLHGKGVVRTSK